MSILAKRNGFTITSPAGKNILEGTVTSGSQGPGRTISFTIEQSPVQYRTVFAQVVPITGQTGDFWDTFWSNKVGGEPADQFALSAFVSVEPSGYFEVTLNADAAPERDEIFELRIYESNMDAVRGYTPLAAGRFTIVDDDNLGTTLHGGPGPDRLEGTSGADTLIGGPGPDTMTGGGGNDIYIVDSADDVVVEAANGGNDAVQASVSYRLSDNVEYLVLTGTGNIAGTGNALDNHLAGNAGNNYLNGGLGADTMVGGAGNDIYVVDNVGDRVIEAAGNGMDAVQASISYFLAPNVEYLVLTGAANINGTGNALDNHIAGNSGNNIINGGIGADTMVGGAGNDIYIVDSAKDLVIEAAGNGNDTVMTAMTHFLGANVEYLVLTGTGNINGTGNALDNHIAGNAGNNIINGGIGADTMVGGAGNDIYIVDNALDLVVEAAGNGTDAVQASVSHILGANIEHLVLAGTDNINGFGNALANHIAGNAGDNLLSGGMGADTLVGGDGDDILIGGLGSDYLVGGLGADHFAFYSVQDAPAGGWDTIQDFSTAQGDRIDLREIDADWGLAGDQQFRFIGENAFSGAAGELRYERAAGTTTISGDVNGDGRADFAIHLTGSIALGATDFLL